MAKFAYYMGVRPSLFERKMKIHEIRAENLKSAREEKARKEREEELAKQARRAAKKPIDINALIRKSNHPDMSVMYYQKLLYTDMTEDELLPYIYLSPFSRRYVLGLFDNGAPTRRENGTSYRKLSTYVSKRPRK